MTASFSRYSYTESFMVILASSICTNMMLLRLLVSNSLWMQVFIVSVHIDSI